MPKDFSLANLYKDLGYIILGTYVHEVLFGLCPPRDDLTVLEAGCGSGKFGLRYALFGANVLCFDIDPQVIEYAERLRMALGHLRGDGVGEVVMTVDSILDMRYLQSTHVWKDWDKTFSVKDLALPEQWDLVFNEGVPQHFPDDETRQKCINEMTRVSKGLVVVIGNNGLNPQEQEIDRTFNFGYMGMPPRRRCFTPDELTDKLKKAGLAGVKCQPLGANWQDATLFAGWGST